MLAKEDLSTRMTQWMGDESKTQSALARETGILQSCVHELMTGWTYPATETIQKMALKTEIDIRWWLTGDRKN